MAQHEDQVGRVPSAQEFDCQAKAAERRASLLRRLLTREPDEQARELRKATGANGKRAAPGRRRWGTA